MALASLAPPWASLGAAAVLAAYALVLAALFGYGLNFYVLLWLARRHRGADPPLPEAGAPAPFVTVQLPIYNERYVARRLIDAACGLDWPADRLEVQVLDDSTDVTRHIAAEAVAAWRARGVAVAHLRRDRRDGYKAGALAAGLEAARGEIVAVFDADFVPPSDFLRRTVPHFADPGLGFLQARWGHLNAGQSRLTRLQALAIDGHFGVEQYARQRGGLFLNFNGTAGLWRAQAIRDAGGWASDTLTEDLDLSYRAQLAGWRPGYVRDVVVPGELPVSVNGFRRQQYRWARGSFECAAKLLGRLVRAPLPARLRLQGVLHLTGYGIHLLMAALGVLYPLVLVVTRDRPALAALFGAAAVFNLTALAPTCYFLGAQHELGRPWRRAVPGVLGLSVLGAGMMVNSVGAAAAAWRGRPGTFERTPKYGLDAADRAWAGKAYAVRASRVVFCEAAFLVWNLNTLRLAVEAGNPAIAFYAAVFATGLGYVLALTAAQALARPAGPVGAGA